MKTKIIFAVVLIALIGQAQAQTSNTFSVREEIVRPSMTPKFLAAMKKFKASCEEAKLTFSWNTISFDDNTYLFIAPLSNTADLDKNPFAGLETKFGKEGSGKIWAEFDGCVESYSEYVITRLADLSYLTPPAGENSRDVTCWYVEPGKEGEAQAILAEWKKMYESKKIQNGYSVYRIKWGKEFGYAIVAWGKSQSDIALKEEKAQELMGQDGMALWTKTQAITRKIYSKRGRVLPEYSYAGK